MIKAYINTPYKKGIFSIYEKKIKKQIGKKNNLSVSRTTLCTQKIKFWKKILENVYLSTKIDLQLKKKQKKLRQIQNFLENFLCRHQNKTASHTISIYGNCMISIFFKKRKPRILITRFVLLESNNRKISLYLFSIIFRNCMKIVWQAFSVYRGQPGMLTHF